MQFNPITIQEFIDIVRGGDREGLRRRDLAAALDSEEGRRELREWSRSSLERLDLSGFDLTKTKLPTTAAAADTLCAYTIGGAAALVPQLLPEGVLVVYKKAFYRDAVGFKRCSVVTLEIPFEAERVMGVLDNPERKARASEARVLAVDALDPDWPAPEDGVFSDWDHSFRYVVGATVKPSGFDGNPFNTCGAGINFFLGYKQAEEYDFQ